jgi:hypothetical protein
MSASTHILYDHAGKTITHGSLRHCDEIRLHYLDVAHMERFRLLSRIFDARAGAIAFRTALDRRNEAICAENAKNFRQQLTGVRTAGRLLQHRASGREEHEGGVMETKFTPGPWEVSMPTATSLEWNVMANGYYVAEVVLGSNGLNNPESTGANAHLIAAAPDLYGAVNALLGLVTLFLSRSDTTTDAQVAIVNNHRLAEAAAALKKARGEPA